MSLFDKESMLLSNVEFIQLHSKPLETTPTCIKNNFDSLKKFKAIIFDVYGTLFISAATDEPPENREILKEISEFVESSPISIQLLRKQIQQSHAESRKQGITHPEVNILSIWQCVLAKASSRPLSEKEIHRIALAYELKSNPVWPMPHALEVIKQAKEKGILLGIVSNAQFYTPLLFEALWSKPLEKLGFMNALCLFSFQEGHAKPEQRLFSKLCRQLQQYNIVPEEALYIGNDSIKDIAPANTAGLQSILFAGDNGSLRMNDQYPLTNVITNWNQLLNFMLDDLNQS